ncbi:MAG TPA: hypothetical protein VMW73_02125 [Spirochaetia bacterium]|nr:hypothetical protein [Spirochaetia bacterium]
MWVSRRLYVPILSLIALIVPISTISAQQTLPQFPVEDLSGTKLSLPDGLAGHPSVLIVGFTRNSGNQTELWARRLARDYDGNSQLSVYTVAILEAVPWLIRNMVVKGMQGGIPEKERSHVLVAFSGEKQWKEAVDYRAKDDAYLLLLDGSGNVVLSTHGAPTASSYADLTARVNRMLGQ